MTLNDLWDCVNHADNVRIDLEFLGEERTVYNGQFSRITTVFFNKFGRTPIGCIGVRNDSDHQPTLYIKLNY